jgi:hypothetical protein
MRSAGLLQQLVKHLDAGGVAKLTIGNDGRRFVKLSKWGIFWSKFEISGATEVSIQNLLLERRSQMPADGRRSTRRSVLSR